jgi:acyl-CoA thioesterase-1
MKTTYKVLKVILLFMIVVMMSSLDEGQNKFKVLIIGDSISMAYTSYVQDILQEKAIVSRPIKADGRAENCQGTTYGMLNLDRWTDREEWDVIHFNFGLHDLKHIDPITKENSTDPQHPLQADAKQYEENLGDIIQKLKATHAKLIFATTTPYPDTANKPLRDPGMAAVYNKIALKVMQENHIQINDLYSFVLPRMAELQRPNNVHFTEVGSRILGEKVAASILASLTSN